MDLAEAEQQALSLTIPANRARVERSAYITSTHVITALRPQDGYVYTTTQYWVDRVAVDTVGAVVAAVEVSLIEIDFPISPEMIGCGRTGATLERRIMTYLFDATTGIVLTIWPAAPNVLWEPAGLVPAALVQELRAIPPLSLSQTPLPTASATPTTTPTIDTRTATALGMGEYPAGLADVIQTLPWTVGGQWRYRDTRVRNGVAWTEAVVDVSVANGWRWAADFMSVNLSHTWTARAGAWTAWLDEHSPWCCQAALVPSAAFVTDHSVPSLRLDPSSPNARARLRLAAEVTPDEWDHGDGLPLAIARLPLERGLLPGLWSVEGVEDVSVPAGDFNGCYVLRHVISAGWSERYWLCPGVGFVQHEAHGTSGMSYGCSVLQLLEYQLPERRPIP